MKAWLTSHVLTLVFSLSGGAGLFALAFKGIGPLVGFAVSAAANNPKLRPILIKYRPEIEATFAEIDADLKSDLDKLPS